MTSNTEGKDILLQQIQKAYERELDLKKNLESKATNVITVCGFIVTLLFGFTAFLSQRDIQIQLFYHLPVFISIGLAIVALWYSLRSLKLREYAYLLSENNRNDSYLLDTVNTFKKLDKHESLDRFIDSYLFSIKANALLNERNALYIIKSQRYLFFAILSIGGIIVVSILLSFINN